MKTFNPDRAAMVAHAQRMRDNGMSYKQIASDMDVSISTVARYLADPTGEKTREQNRKYAVRHGGRPAGRRRKPGPTREEAEVAHNHMELPISNKITMRPVWQRRQRRIYMQGPMPPPTDEEKADAISILGDKRIEKYGPALWFDAFLIMDEAGK